MEKRDKKIKNIIITILALGVFSYTMYDAFKNNNPPPRLSETQKRKVFIEGFIKSTRFLAYTDSSTAWQFGECFYDDFIAKYGYEKLAEWEAKSLKGDTVGLSGIIMPVFEKCREQFAEKLLRPQSINGCINTVLKTSSYTKIQAESYCSCFYDYLANKYGPQVASHASDSLLLVETYQRQKCLEEATRTNTATAMKNPQTPQINPRNP